MPFVLMGTSPSLCSATAMAMLAEVVALLVLVVEEVQRCEGNLSESIPPPGTTPATSTRRRAAVNAGEGRP